MKFRQHSIIPGFSLSLGYTITYLSLLVLIPLTAVFVSAGKLTWSEFWHTVTAPRIQASYKLSFGAAFIAALINGVFGLLIAWVLVRYDFRGKRIINATIDLPFALPTAVAGIALTTIYAPTGWMGVILEHIGITAVFNPLGIIIALTFIGLPFVVRTIEPVLEDLGKETQEAAESLGARGSQIFRRVIFPEVLPAVITGMTLAFARGLGEYGSVVFISGNMPMRTEITPLLIVSKLEQFDYAGATAIAVVMLVISFILLLLTNLLQKRIARYQTV